tara:strand:+ start:30164 stop:31036 length:873 start_codon:yes stop_codon:yes gene_type:complete
MKLRIFALVAATTMGFTASAQTALTGAVNQAATTIGDLYKTLEESPAYANYLIETSAIRDSKNNEKFSGAGLDNFITVGYKINDKNKVYMDNLWSSQFNSTKEDSTEWSYTNFNYSRSGLMPANDLGLNLTFKLRQRIYTPDTSLGSREFYGYTRPGLTLSGSITDSLSASFTTAVALYNRGSRVAKGDLNSRTMTSNLYIYPYLSVAYRATDKLTVSSLVEVLKYYKNNGASNNIAGYLTIGAYYQAFKKVSFGGSVAHTLSSDFRNDGYNNVDHDSLSYALNAYMSLF